MPRKVWIGAAIAAGLGAVGLIGLSILNGPVGQVHAEARRAYEEAIAAVAQGEADVRSANASVLEADDAQLVALEKASEARANVAAKERDEQPTVVRNSFFWIDGSYYSYCRPDANGEFIQNRTGRKFYCSRSLGPYSYMPAVGYKGPLSPWVIDYRSASYSGDVSGETPQGSGEFSLGNESLSGSIRSLAGNKLAMLGSAFASVDGTSLAVVGDIQAELTSDSIAVMTLVGEVTSFPRQGSKFVGRFTASVFSGSEQRDGAVIATGKFWSTPATRENPNFSGRVDLGGGKAFVGVQRGASSIWWGGLIENGEVYYLGQVRDGLPEGCGVRISRNGARRGVYISNGLEDPQAFRSLCSNVRYSGTGK